MKFSYLRQITNATISFGGHHNNQIKPMALSEQTAESLKKAETHLRDALAFAARVEKPYIVRELGTILSHLDNIQATDSLFDRMSTAIDRMEQDDKQ